MLSSHRRTATALPSRHWVKMSSIARTQALSPRAWGTLGTGDNTGIQGKEMSPSFIPYRKVVLALQEWVLHSPVSGGL